MALTVADVLGVFAPSYVGDSRITVATTMATAQIVGLTCLLGDLRTMATAYLVAHALTMGDRQQAAADAGGAGGVAVGGVTAQAAGGVSQSYGSLGATGAGGWYADDVYRTTPGGLEWLRIRESLPCARAIAWAR